MRGDRGQVDPAPVPIARAVEDADLRSHGREVLLQAPGAFHVVSPLQVILLHIGKKKRVAGRRGVGDIDHGTDHAGRETVIVVVVIVQGQP